MPRLAALLLLTCVLAASEAEHLRLLLNYSHQFQFAGYYEADDLGYFREVGLDVEIVELRPGMRIRDELDRNTCQFAIHTAQIMGDWAEGADLGLVAIFLQRNPCALLVRNESPLFSLADLLRLPKLRLVGPASFSDIELDVALRGLGRLPDDVFSRAKQPSDLDAFAAGELDALPGYLSNEPARLKRLGISTRPLSYRVGQRSPFFGDTLICRGETLRTRPDLARRFRAACIKGWNEALDHPQEAIGRILSKRPSRWQELTREGLTDEANAIAPLIDRDVIPLGEISTARLESAAMSLRSVGMPGLVRHDMILDETAAPILHWNSLLLWALGLAGAACAGLLAANLIHRRRLERSDQLNRTMMDLAEGFFLFQAQAEGATSLRFLNASRSIARILGQALPAWRDDPDRLLRQVHPDDRRDLLASIAHGIGSGSPLRCRFRFQAVGSAKTSHLLLQANPLPHTQPLEYEGICLDLSTEAEAEAALRQMQEKLERTQRHESLGLLAGGVAHDFNNLLGGIRGNAELALTGLPAEHPAAARINRVLQAADRAAGLVRQILAYAGRGTIEVRAIDLAEELKVLRDLLKHSIPKNIEIALDLQPGIDRVLFDPAQLQQVLVNLIVNAAESYEGRGGRVLIQVRASGKDRVGIEISDQGCGMDADTQARMFEPYFTTKKNGHGLGLAAVRGILQQAKATLQCDSTPGVGTTFTVTLVSGIAPEAQGPQTDAVMAPVGGRHLLVADDEEMVREITASMVRELGYSCDLATNGEEALRLIAEGQGRYAAAIIDCVMPDRGGIEIQHELRQAKNRLPILLVSGMLDDQKLGTGVLDRRTRFLPKPFSKAMLDRTLQVLLKPRHDDDSSATFASLMRESSVQRVIRHPVP